jgi:hypothetical protein
MTPKSPSAATRANTAIIASVFIFFMFTENKKVLKVTGRKMSQNHFILTISLGRECLFFSNTFIKLNSGKVLTEQYLNSVRQSEHYPSSMIELLFFVGSKDQGLVIL